MATYYVSPSGSNTAPYDTWAKASTTTAAVVTHGQGVVGPHTVYIAPGTYAAMLDVAGANWTNSVFIGVSSTVFMGVASFDLVRFAVASSFAGRFSSAGITARGVSWISNAGNNLYVAAANFLAEKCYVSGPGGMLFDYDSTMDSCLVEGYAQYHNMRNAANVVFKNTVLKNSAAGFYTQNVIYSTSTGIVDINNCLIMGTGDGSGGPVRMNNAAGKIRVKNSILMSGVASPVVLNNTAGAIEYSNNLLVAGWDSSKSYAVTFGTCTDLGGNVIAAPRIVRPNRSGYICVNVDDINVPIYNSLEYVASLVPVLQTYGARFTWYINTQELPGNEAAVMDIYDSGIVELGIHSHSHSNMILTGAAFSITKSGHTINVDRSADTITVAGASPVTVSGFKAKRISAIKAELTAGGCTCGANVVGLNDTLGESLNTSPGAQVSPYSPQLLIDATCATGYFKVEIKDPIGIMQSLLGVTPKSFATPGGTQSAGVIAAIKAAGYHSGRYSLGGASLAGIDFSITQYRTLGSILGANETIAKRNIGLLAHHVADLGLVVCVSSHGVSDGTLAQWDLFLSEAVKYDGVQLVALSDVSDAIKADARWTSADGFAYVRASWPGVGDYHLIPTSPCIGAGADVGLTTDADGNAVHGAVGFDIGPYSYMPGWKVNADDFASLQLPTRAPSAPVAYTDGGTLVVRFTATSASADIVGDVQVFGPVYAYSGGLKFKDGVNTATCYATWAANDIITAIVSVTADDTMQIGVY